MTQNTGSNSSKGHAYELKWDKINKGDIIASTAPDAQTKSEVKGNVQIHYKTVSPLSKTLNATTPGGGDYRIDFDDSYMSSNIILNSFANEKDKDKVGITMKVFVEVYGNYNQKDEKGERIKDPTGDQLIQTCATINSSFAESVDSNTETKRKILAPLKFANIKDAMDKPFESTYMNSVVRQPTIDDENSPLNGEIDTTRSPSIGFELWISVPKQKDVNHFQIPGTDQVIYTRIYDHTKGITAAPIKSFDHLMNFVYQKGESKETGRRPFRLRITFKTLAPSFYINSEKKTGHLQFKISELHIAEVDHPRSSDVMSDAQKNDIQNRLMRSMNKYVINREPLPSTNPDISSSQSTNASNNTNENSNTFDGNKDEGNNSNNKRKAIDEANKDASSPTKKALKENTYANSIDEMINSQFDL